MALFGGLRDGWRRMFGGAPHGDGEHDPHGFLASGRRGQDQLSTGGTQVANGGLPRVAAPILAPSPAEELRMAFDRLSVQLEGHLGREAGALEELRTSLEPLGRVGESLGELRRSAITLNDTLSEHAEHARRSAEGTQSLLQRVGDSLVAQADVVGGMQQQIDGLVRTFATVGEDLDRLRASLGQIADHSSRSAGSLVELVEHQSLRDGALVDELRRFRSWTLGLLAAILVVALGAGALAIAALTLSRGPA